jgi:hypothetical protein
MPSNLHALESGNFKMKSISLLMAYRKGSALLAVLIIAACASSGCASRSQFQKGYDRGAGDTAKRQYWILQEMQKRQTPPREPRRATYYRLPVEPDPKSPVKTVPYEIAIPIHE